jgi:hypothetical protein
MQSFAIIFSFFSWEGVDNKNPDLLCVVLQKFNAGRFSAVPIDMFRLCKLTKRRFISQNQKKEQ